MAYRMTPRRLRQIRNAQMISARKRKGRGRKLSKGHKRVIAVAAAGAVVAGGVYGTSAWMNASQRKAKIKAMKSHREQARLNVNRRRLARSPDMSRSRGGYRDAWSNELINGHDDGTMALAAPSRVVRAVGGVKVNTSVRHPLARQIMQEIHKTSVPGRPASSRYKVIFGS